MNLLSVKFLEYIKHLQNVVDCYHYKDLYDLKFYNEKAFEGIT